MHPIKFLLIGCGAVSEILYKPAFHNLRETGKGTLVAVVDTNLQRAKEYASVFGANVYDNLDMALKNEKLDAAVVATPHAFHAPITIQCLNAGLGVLCEKPLAISYEECESMIATAKKVKKPLTVGFFRRNFPSTRAIKLLIEKEALGPVISFEFLEGEKYSWPAKTTSFFSKKIAGGGVLIDAGAHLIDLLLWWLGDVNLVDYSDDSMGGVEANCELNLTMKSGVTGRVRMSREYPLENQYVIHCKNGDLIYKCDVVNSIFIKDNQTGITTEYNLQKIQCFVDIEFPFISDASRFSFLECFFEQLEKFSTVINDLQNVTYDLDYAEKGIQLIERCYKIKKFMSMLWLSGAENTQALKLSSSSTNLTIPPTNGSENRIKIGVVGAGGFVGYRLCEWLILNNRAEVIPIIHSAKNFALLGRFNLKAEFADLLDQPSLEKSFAGKDFIVHVAVGDDRTIVQGIENTLRAAKSAGVKRIIYLSTVCVYGNAPEDGTDEKSPLLKNQKFSYNNSKVKAEEIIYQLKKDLSLDVVILRPLLIWGPRSQYWVIEIGEKIKSGTSFLINNGQGICNCTYVDNLIEAIWLAITTENGKSEDFIIMDNETITWREYYAGLAGILGVNLTSESISLDDLNRKLSQNRQINRKMFIKTLLIRWGSRNLPSFIKTKIKTKIRQISPEIINVIEPVIDEEISSLQLSHYKLKSEKAKMILRYKGLITFNEGMRLTNNWIHFVQGKL
jgi:predicted dehydrogenase/nucleoside-diphosphate-sugar epimerase